MPEPQDSNARTDADMHADVLIGYDDALLKGHDYAAPPPDCDRRGELAEDIACLELLHRVLRPGNDPAQAMTLGSVKDPSPAAPAATDIPRKIGRFEVLRELGRGGYGIVVLALDPNLDRLVAVKIPRPEVLVSSVLRERFLREAATAGRLDHPNLVPVFEVGEDGPLWYIAAAYVSGGTMSKWLAGLREPLPPHAAAALVAQLADAAQHAHSAGILHRDIKPGNVLMQPEDETVDGESLSRYAVLGYVPRLCDFGLAKLLDAEGDETISGTLLGTPAYMAPEQATGQTSHLGTATDVYGLGAILYELLTDSAPFRGGNSIETLRRVVQDEVVPPRKLRPAIDRDLEAICLKCLEKKPGDRYQTARELALDLRRFLAGIPTEARVVTRAERLAKWCRREPALAAGAAMAMASCMALVVGLAWSNYRIARARDVAQLSDLRTRQLLYASDLQLAQNAMLNSDYGTAKSILGKHLPADSAADERDFAWWFMWNALHREVASLPAHGDDVYALAYAPDGRRLATTCRDGGTRIWSLPERRLVKHFKDHDGEVNCVAFSGDGSLLATGGDDHIVLVRDATTYEIRHRLVALPPEADAFVSATLFHPDSRRLFVAAGGEIQVWDALSGEQLAHAAAHEHTIKNLALSPDGQRLVSVERDLILWETAGLTAIEKARLPSPNIYTSACFVDGGQRVALADDGGTIYVCDSQTLARIHRVRTRLTAGILAMHVSPDGRWLAAGSADRSIAVLEVDAWEVYTQFESHGDRVWDVKWSTTGDSLASCDGDGTVKFWSLPSDDRWRSRDGTQALANEDLEFDSFTYSPDGTLLAAAMNRSRILLRDIAAERSLRLPVPPENGWIAHLEFTRDGRQLVSCHANAVIKIWDVATASHVADVKVPGQLSAMALDPTGQHCIVAVTHTAEMPDPGQRFVAVLEWPSGRQRAKLPVVENPVTKLAFTPAGDEFVVVRNGLIAFYDVQSLETRLKLGRSADAFVDLAFLPDDRFIVAEWRQGATLRDLKTGAVQARLSGHAGVVSAVAAHPNGRNVATLCDPGILQVWDLRTQQPLIRISDVTRPDHGGMLFEPRGRQLAVQQPFELAVWDGQPADDAAPSPIRPLRSQGPQLRWPGEFMDRDSIATTIPDPIQEIGWSHDSQHVLIADNAGGLYRWQPESANRPVRLATKLDSPARILRSAPRRDLWVIVCENDTAQVWRGAESGQTPFPVPPSCDCALDPAGEILVVIDSEAIAAHSTATGETLWKVSHDGKHYGTAFAGADFVAVSYDTGAYRLHRLADGQVGWERRLEQSWYRNLVGSSDAQQLAAVRRDGTTDLLDRTSGEILSSTSHPAEWMLYLGDSHRALTCQEMAFDIFDLDTGKVVGTLPPVLKKHVVSPNGRWLACCDKERLAVLRIAPQGTPLAP
ncbi:MAG: protein kinase [Planctomycetaceae bacterium]|nr:protein kinase [Planctomycetaceae bacterium]